MFHFYWDRKNKTIIGLWLFDDAEVEAGWWVQRHFDSEKMYRHFLQISNFIIFWRKRSVFNHLSKTSFRLTTSKRGFWVAILDYKNLFVQFSSKFWILLSIVQCGNKVNVLFHPSEHYHLPATKLNTACWGQMVLGKNYHKVASRNTCY